MAGLKGRRDRAAGGEPALPDRTAREKIRTELDRNFLVEAGAGSGKTQVLVERLTALIRAGAARMEEVAAVTFTRRAAAELRGRVQLELERMFAAEQDASVKDRLAAALERLELGFIGTIHSFASLLLRERPIEAGVDPAFDEMDEAEDGLFREACWHDFLVRVRLEQPRVLDRLAEAGIDAPDLKEAFSRLAAYPETVPVGGRSDPPDRLNLLAALKAFLAELKRLMPETEPDKGYDGLQSACLRAERRLKRLDPENRLRDLMETLELFEKKVGVKPTRWPSKQTSAEAEALLEVFKDGTVLPALKHWREYRHEAALALLVPAAEFYAGRRRELSRLNFTDQLLLASRMLRDNPEVRRYFQKRFRRLFVDEFQDTDPVQAEIVFFLTGGDKEERDWTRLVPEPGSLFLVGDPKQSIYRFRRADIDIYNLAREVIVRGGGEVLELVANFRSSECLLGRVNPMFGGLFPSEASRHQPAFQPLRAARRPNSDCLELWGGLAKMTVPKVGRNRGGDIALLDAARIAEFIAWSVDGNFRVSERWGGTRPARPGDFLVLFRYKKDMAVYAAGLEKLVVPYEIAGSEAFSEREEVTELMRLLACLAERDNSVLLVAVLRGLFFGISDQVLLEHREAGGCFLIGEDGRADAPGHPRVLRALGTLRRWRELTLREPASLVLERVVEENGLLVHLVSSERGGTRAANVFKLIEVLKSRESEGLTGLRSAVDYLNQWLSWSGAEEMSLSPAGGRAVRLMNLHKAKGLEAPVVILANPKGIEDHEPEQHIERRAGGRAGEAAGRQAAPLAYYRFCKPGSYRSKPVLSQCLGWEEKSRDEAAYMEAEEVRLMYVAATRARDLLVVSVYEDRLTSPAWSAIDERLRGAGDGPAADCFADIPELELLAGAAVTAVSKDRLEVPDGVVRARRTEMSGRVGLALRAGYYLESVTGLVKERRPYPAARGSEHGLKWGSAVHLMLNRFGREWTGRQPDAGRLLLSARNAAAAAELEAAEAAGLAELVSGILRSGFWERAMAAGRKLFEVPFTISVGPREPGYRKLVSRVGFFREAGGEVVDVRPGAPFILSGVMDLVFEEPDGWVIADYKTDRIQDVPGEATAAERKRALVDYYRPQVELYTTCWERITGLPVKESGLYFISIGEWAGIDRPGQGRSGRRA